MLDQWDVTKLAAKHGARGLNLRATLWLITLDAALRQKLWSYANVMLIWRQRQVAPSRGATLETAAQVCCGPWISAFVKCWS